jgi:hypothetical protein
MSTHGDQSQTDLTGPKFADIHTISRVVGHPKYQQLCTRYRSFLSRSRAVGDDPQELLHLQADIAETLLGLEAAQRKQKKRLGNNHLKVEEVGEAKLRAAVARRLAHIVREIADGIAWRFFYYDRAGLYQLARKPQVGHLDEANINYEMARAEAHGARGALVLLNDLTNFVRYGDLSLRTDDGFTFIETKGGEGSAGSGHATRQQRKLREMRDFINTGSKQTPEGNECIYRLTTQPKTHLAEVAELIREASQQGKVHARLSDCLAVDVYHVETASASPRGRRRLLNVRDNPFSESMKAFACHSLDLFNQFTPNRAPYSVFPWPDDVCTDLLEGRIWIVSYFNWGKLERSLKKRGLRVGEELDRERVLQFRALPFAEQKRKGLWMSVGRPNSTPLRISFVELARLAYEFLDEQSFADAIEELSEIGISSGDTYFTAFENEAQIWN